MKKIMALMLALFMVVGVLSACGSTNGTTTTTKGAATTTTAVPTTTAAPTTTVAANPIPDWTAFDELIAQIKSSTDFVAREALMHEAEDMLMETGCLMPIYYYNDIFMQKANVTGIYSSVYGTKYFMYSNTADGTLRLCLASEPAKLDPALNSSVDGACLAANSFVGLYVYNDKGELAPALAKGYTLSADGLTYTFNLKDDLKWSDGSVLDANDFVYAWHRAADPATAADYSYMLNGIAGFDENNLQVSASADGKTFTVVLKAPCAYFLDLCAFPTFLPVKQSEVEGAADYATNPGAWALEAGFISNGAYTLESWKHNESMVYVKNPYYYDAANVKTERLEFMLSDDDPAIFAAYNAGDLDFIDSVPNDEIAALLENPEFHIAKQLGTYYVVFNIKSPLYEGKTVAQANAMRHAISLLVDRDYIAENIGQTGQETANAFIPAGMYDGHGGIFKTNDADYTYPDKETVGYFDPSYSNKNVTEAISLLESAGFVFENGMLSASTPLKFEYLTNSSSAHIAIAEAIQQDLAVIGIDMTIKTVEWSVFLEERKAGNYDVARNGWIADFNDPVNMLEMWTTESGNNDAQFGK